MATITIRNRDNLQLPANPAISLLQLLGQNGIAVPTKCGGHARCGQCRITFHSGMERAAPMTVFEQHFRLKHEIPDNVRLACQTHVAGDAVISIGQKAGD